MDGFVLAGGASSRFGSNKAVALWEEKPLLAWSLAAIRELGITPRVVTRNPLPYRRFATAFVISERAGGGPLEGVRSLLQSSTSPRSLVLSVDMPRVTATVLRHLITQAEGSEVPVCFEDVGGRRHPFPGVYPQAALETLARLDHGVSVQALLDQTRVRCLDPASLGIPSFLHNVNRREDLKKPVKPLPEYD